MSMTDPIADFLTRVRNGAVARKDYIECPWSKIKERLAVVLVAEGYLKDVNVVEIDATKKNLRAWLQYDKGHASVITGIKRVSRPSQRIYVSAKAMPSVRRGLGISVLSTPEGILVDREAVRRKVGGELLCSVW
jgi:small subunit ribosomal protein S8